MANPAATPIPFGFTFDNYTFDNYGHLIVTESANSTLSTYTVQPDGTVTLIASQPDGEVAMCWVAQAAGNFSVSDTGSGNLTGYHIDPAGTPTTFAKVDTRGGPVDLVGTRDGSFLYVQVGGVGGIDGFRIKDDGTLAQIVTLTGLDGLEGIAVA